MPSRNAKSGLSTPQFVGTSNSWSKANGREVTRIYLGQLADCQTQESVEIAANCTRTSIDRLSDSPDWQLRATYPFDPGEGDEPVTESDIDIVNTYELLDNQLQQSTAFNTVLSGLIVADGGDSDTIISAVDIYNRYSSGTITLDAAGLELFALNLTSYTNITDFWNDMVKGVDQYFTGHYVFRRTLTVVDPDQVRAAFDGVEQIFSEQQLIDYEQLQAAYETMFFVIPTGYEWLKQRPNVIATANQKTQIVYEYWAAEDWDSKYYSDFVYNPA